MFEKNPHRIKNFRHIFYCLKNENYSEKEFKHEDI